MEKTDNLIPPKLLGRVNHRGSPLGERLNRQVLQTLRDLAIPYEPDPGIEDEYEFEIFGNIGPTKQKQLK